MKRDFLSVSIMTKIERNDAIARVSSAISASDGWIVNHTLFSNIAATINFEFPANNTDSFLASLKQSSFDPQLDREMPDRSEGDLRAQISITFLHDQPDLKRDVPTFG